MSDAGTESRIIEAEPARPVGGQPAGRQDRARSSGYRSRFVAVYVGLSVLTGGAIGALAVLLARPDAAPPAPWSTWEPTGGDTTRVRQIASRVAKGYRHAGGQQLTVALAGPPTVTSSDGQAVNVPVRAVAVLPDTAEGKQEDTDVDIFNSDGTLQFVLCGLGDNCSITGGQASEARHALLRREALELALYTFKYVDGVDSVAVLLPPRPDLQASPTAVFLRRGDVRPLLGRPLARSLAATPPAIGQIPRAELDVVDDVTRPRLYTYEYRQAQDGSAVLVFNPSLS